MEEGNAQPEVRYCRCGTCASMIHTGVTGQGRGDWTPSSGLEASV